jgi:hypothetical protein
MADTTEFSNLTPENLETLVNFKEITHIESTEECKQILEAFGWNLELAVQNTFSDQQTDQAADVRESQQFANANSDPNPISFLQPQPPPTPFSFPITNNLESN